MDIAGLAPRIQAILQLSDLCMVSAQDVRQQLELELNISLDSYKAEVNEITKIQFEKFYTGPRMCAYIYEQNVQTPYY
ncbi:hypothetical protein J3B01_001900 [Coemansia erecta]|nr:hypothetical protein J3B01_001900 [Coemansia erecta]